MKKLLLTGCVILSGVVLAGDSKDARCRQHGVTVAVECVKHCNRNFPDKSSADYQWCYEDCFQKGKDALKECMED